MSLKKLHEEIASDRNGLGSDFIYREIIDIQLYKEFDPGSGRTLAARLTHASRTDEKELASSS